MFGFRADVIAGQGLQACHRGQRLRGVTKKGDEGLQQQKSNGVDELLGNS